MLKNIKENLLDYVHSLTVYDYAAFGWLLFLFLIFLTLAILLGRKKPTLAIALIMITILLMFVAPFGIKYFLDTTVRKVDVVTDKVAKLHFASSLIVTGHITNAGKVPYQKCRINAKVFKISENKYRNILNNLKPLRNKTIVVDKNISQGEEAMFKIVFENFKYSKEYNVSVSGACY
ncbi:MAG TPA: DUF2393 domain-containing protein [Campylobacterales bacterium]|nr:DUF2393 domain-containing protein [Campylobacterales bacterium]